MSNTDESRGSYLAALLFYPLAICFLELLLKGLDQYDTFLDISLLPTVLFSLATGFLLAFVFLLIKPVVLSRILSGITMFALWLIFCVEFDCNVFYKIYYGIVYSLQMTGSVMGDFSANVWDVALKYIGYEILFAVPMIIYFIFMKKIIPPKSVPRKKTPFVLIPFVGLFAAAVLFSRLGPNADVYTYSFTVPTSVPKIGLLNSFRLELTYMALGTPEEKLESGEYVLWTDQNTTSEIASAVPDSSEMSSENDGGTAGGKEDPDGKEGNSEENSEIPSEPEPPKEYAYNATVDFASLIENETNGKLKSMHEYFGSIEPTKQNEYTGIFAGKNLVFLTAEAFSPYAVDKDFTPTLYKLANEGFVFTDYYQPSWSLSTTGGEFSNLTGIIPMWMEGGNSFIASIRDYMPYAPGNMFGAAGYRCRAYHNSGYSYYDRDKTHPNLGYDYKGIGNGLKMELGGWPYSDYLMIEATIDEAIEEQKETGQPFHTYYMTVSGHCNYGWGANAQSGKHKEEAKEAFPDEPTVVQAYKAANKELDLALEYLVDKLDEAGILDDTVIVMGADHYPYAMVEQGTDYYKIMSGIDDTPNSISRYQNTLIIYCSAMEEPVIVDTPCSSIDIMPTLANLFGMEYDSRLYSGRDIFATNYEADKASYTMPLVIVPVSGGYSFVTAAGQYDVRTREFTPNEGITVDDEYVEEVQQIISEKWKYARLIIANNYYKAVIPMPEKETESKK